MPFESESISAMPIMPMLPAKAVRMVRAFLVMRLLSERESAVKKLIEGRFLFVSRGLSGTESGSKGSVSPWIWPSSSRTIRVEYFSARSGLCVTMMTSLSLEISFKSSMICTLVSESSAPVGSSASRMSGSFMSARAMATRCI